jgi:hypothetical protein
METAAIILLYGNPERLFVPFNHIIEAGFARQSIIYNSNNLTAAIDPMDHSISNLIGCHYSKSSQTWASAHPVRMLSSQSHKL